MKARDIILEALLRENDFDDEFPDNTRRKLMVPRDVEAAVVAAGLAALDNCPQDDVSWRNVKEIHTVWSLPPKDGYAEVEFSNHDLYGRKKIEWTWVGRDEEGLYADQAIYAKSRTFISQGFWKHGQLYGKTFATYDIARKSRDEYVAYIPKDVKWYSDSERAVLDQIGCALHAYLPAER